MRRVWLGLGMVAGLAWAKPPELPQARWVTQDGVLWCVSSVPSAKPMRGRDRDAYLAAVEALAEGDLTVERLAPHQRAAASAKPHPAWEVWLATLEMWKDGGGDTLVALADAWPVDACIGTAAATWAAKQRGGTKETMRLAARAWTRAPNPQLALVMGRILDQDKEDERLLAVLQRGLRLDPEHAGLKRLRAGLALRRGETLGDNADELLSLGDPDLDPLLLKATFEQRRMDDYLRLAVRQGAPLGPASDLSEDEISLAALRERLGLSSPTERLYAVLHTTEGEVSCDLLVDEAPVTVAAFVGLATGTQDWTHPLTKAPGSGPLYRDVPFHRVIPGFMVQTGDPKGDGSGDPGYRFHDELSPGRRFDAPGRLAMANSGPGTNGSQFFITDGAAFHLDGKHTIFGICGAPAVVSAIANVDRDGRDRPRRRVMLERVVIEVR